MAQRAGEGLRGALKTLVAMMRQRPWLAGVLAVALGILLITGMVGVNAASGRTHLIVREEQSVDTPGAVDGNAGDGERTARETANGAEASAAESDAGPAVEGAPETIVVDVSGAVVSPSVVRVPADARVQDAIDAAGGLAADADISALNRAAVLTDGMKVLVPRIGEGLSSGAAEDATAASGTGTFPSTPSSAQGSPVNINRAGADELDTLPGIGPATAQAIIEDRTAHGPFTAPEDLMRVSGIGEKKFERLQGLICI